MPQLTLFKRLQNKQVGNITLDTTTNFAVGDTVTGGSSAAHAKVIKVVSATILRVNRITGVFADGETVTNGSTGTGVVATNGFDLSITASGLLRTFRVGARVRTELLTALRNFNTKSTDAVTPPTFTAAVSYSGTAAMVTGNVMTVTVTANEEVAVAADAYVAITIGVNTRHAVFVPALSTATDQVFEYTIVAGDSATAGNIHVGTTIVGAVADVVGEILVPATVTFVAPNTSTATAN